MRCDIPRPLNPAYFFRPPIAHARMHRTQLPQLVPNVFGVRFSPVVAESARQLKNNPHVIQHTVGQRHCRAHALNAPFTARHRPFRLAPSGGPREDHISHFRGLRIKKILHYHEFQPAKQLHGAVPVGLRIHGVLSQHIQRRQFPALHGVEHRAQMPSAFRVNLRAPRAFEFRAQLGIFHVLEARQAVGNRAHVAAALHVILPAQRIYAAAVSPDVSRQQREVDQRHHVVDSVMMFRNSERPANLRALGFRISVCRPPDYLRRHTRFAFGSLQRIFLDALAVRIESARRVLDEFLVRKTRRNNFAPHGVGQRNVTPHIQPQPHIRPLRRTRTPWIYHVQLSAVANALEHVVKKNRMSVPGVRTPQQDYFTLFNFAVRTRPAPRSKNRRQTGDARGMSSAVTTVDVVGADYRAHKFLRHVIQLIGGLRATEHPERMRPVLFNLFAESRGHPVERFIPARRAMLPVLAKQRSWESFFLRVTHIFASLSLFGFYDTFMHGKLVIPTLLKQDVLIIQLQYSRTWLAYFELKLSGIEND